MDSCGRLSYSKAFFRQSTPSTSYSTYSSPTLSPVQSSNPQKKSPEISPFSKVFENFCTQYFRLNTYKDEVNDRCINIVQKQNELSELKKNILIHMQASESRLNFKDLEKFQEYIQGLECQNLKEKQKLKKIIQEYFDAVEQTKNLNSALKELMDMNERSEELAERLCYLNTHTKVLIQKQLLLESEHNKVSSERFLLTNRSSNNTQTSQPLSLRTLQTQISDTKNVVAYLDTRTEFTHSDLSSYQSLLTQKSEKLQKTRCSISRLKSSLLSKESILSLAKNSCKARLENLSQYKSKNESLRMAIVSCESSQSTKEEYLSGLESALYSQYEILEKLYICKNLY